MSRAQVNKLYRSFVKGLITEASPLTFPDDATIDEDNMILFQSGQRSRRPGIDYEAGAHDSSYFTPITTFANTAVTTHNWLSADNREDKNLIVVQVGSKLHFYDQGSIPFSSNEKSFVVDLTDFAINSQDPTPYEIQTAVGKGYIFVVHPVCDPFLIAYNAVNDTISTQRLYILIRDFKGVDDGLSIDTEPTVLSNEHQYNLLNQGWLDPANDATGTSVTTYTIFGQKQTVAQAATTPITTYHTSTGRYPGNNKQWWAAKNSSTGAFDPALLTKIFFGTVRSPRGHYVVEAFNIDRTAVSGVSSLAVESVTNRPNCVAFFGGRVWYGKDSNVYYSQILDDKSKAGSCYQEADPTSESISDLIATDGGVIQIPEMIHINRMVAVAGGMVCFATNGIWFVGGSTSGFSATDITVTKINPVGTASPNSVVHVQTGNNDMVLWWSKVGIQAMQQRSGSFGPVDNRFDSTIVSLTTIQTFFHNIPQQQLPYVQSSYDPATNRVQWLYNDGNAPDPYTFNRVLNYDLTLKAFYPWTFSSGAEGPYVCGIIEVIKDLDISQTNPFTKFLVAKPIDPKYVFTFAQINNARFADWDTYNYRSFMETGYEILQDAMRKKEATYVFCYFQRTEENFVPTGSLGEYTIDKPSSCHMQVKWDWTDTQAANKWSSKTQVYRLTRVPEFNPGVSLVFDNGMPVTFSRNRIRGHGKSIQFRFENDEIGTDFNILGWAVPYTGNTQP